MSNPDVNYPLDKSGHEFSGQPFAYHGGENPHTHDICIQCAAIWHVKNIVEEPDSWNKCGSIPRYIASRHESWYEENVGPFPPQNGTARNRRGYMVKGLF